MRKERGFSLIEMLTTLSLTTIISGMVAFNIHETMNTSRTTGDLVAQFVRVARSRALASSTSYIVRPSTSGEIIESFAVQSCNANAQPLPLNTRQYTLPTNFKIEPANWSVCFQSRGLVRGQANANVLFSVKSKAVVGESWDIEIALGGAVSVVDAGA